MFSHVFCATLLLLAAVSCFSSALGTTTREPTATTTVTTQRPTVTTRGTTGGTTVTIRGTTRGPTVTTHGPTGKTTRSPTTRAKGTTGTPVTTTPAPPPGVGNWTLRDSKGKICMRMSFAAQLNITYTKVDGKEGVAVFNVNPNVDAGSECNASSTRTMTIYPFNRTHQNWKIQLTFARQSGKYALTKVGESWVYDDHFVDHRASGWSSESRGQNNFLDQRVALGKSYKCANPLTVTTGQATLRLSHILLQPFAEDADGKFGEAVPCATGLSLTIIIVIAVVGSVLLITAVVVVIVVARKLRKKKYATFENEA